MRRSLCPSLFLFVLLAGCVPPATSPRPQQSKPPARIAPVVPPKQAPLIQASEDWRDLPLTSGSWRYLSATDASSFGPAGNDLFSVRCDKAQQAIVLSRSGSASGPLMIQTSASRRSFPIMVTAGRLLVSFSARDPFLDAIAFSRGRFVVTSGADPRLVIPSWPEFARVVEDCRG